ncbi:hypothetical protein FJTKL_07924 [Diaporthe vaccinii]|uniref:Uncharacterized protein n=1 Tax=Diaporthe vaccinii TaxID=105482 RepID=A0ABR4FEE6_9PEZI
MTSGLDSRFLNFPIIDAGHLCLFGGDMFPSRAMHATAIVADPIPHMLALTRETRTLRCLSFAEVGGACLCGGLDLGDGLALLESSLLLEAQDLEAVEVGQGRSLGLLGLGLGPVGRLPLAVDLGLLPELLDGWRPGAPGQVGYHEVGEQDVGEGNGLSGNSEGGIGGGAVNKGL